MVTLSIIILSYNTGKVTLRCIESLLDNYKEELANGSFQIIIVDNASSDESVALIKEFKNKKKNLNITLLENKENVGFGGGNNAGSKKADGEFLLFLNSDTQVLDKGISQMLDFLRVHPKVGILGGKLCNTDGSSQKSVGIFYTIPTLFISLFGGERMGLLRKSPKAAKRVDWVSGALCMTPAEVFKKVGGFDQNLFMYMEDMELCYRVRKSGYDVFFYPDVSVRHDEQGSSNRTFAIVSIYKGVLYYFKKHRSVFEYHFAKKSLLLKGWSAIVIGTLTNNSYLSDTYKKAIQF
jgi:GT2 family glycosyltransferase